MASSWLTWAGLGLDATERKACRRAGLAATDVATMRPLDLVAATDELVDEVRADHLVRRAGLLQLFTPARVDRLERFGVRSREDLASRDADELFLVYQENPYTRPDMHRILAEMIHVAGGPPPVPVPDDELVRRQWVHRYGDRSPGTRGKRRLRIPTLQVNAPVWEADADGVGPWPPPPLDHRGVSVAERDGRIVVVGHWQWAGHFAAFLRLEDLGPGDEIELTGAGTFAVQSVARGVAPVGLPESAALTLLTPPHHRWPPWCREWGLPGLDPEATPVQVVVAADR